MRVQDLQAGFRVQGLRFRGFEEVWWKAVFLWKGAWRRIASSRVEVYLWFVGSWALTLDSKPEP